VQIIDQKVQVYEDFRFLNITSGSGTSDKIENLSNVSGNSSTNSTLSLRVNPTTVPLRVTPTTVASFRTRKRLSSTRPSDKMASVKKVSLKTTEKPITTKRVRWIVRSTYDLTTIPKTTPVPLCLPCFQYFYTSNNCPLLTTKDKEGLSVNTGLNTIENTTTDRFNTSENTASSENMMSVSRQTNNSFVNSTSNTWNIPQANTIRKTTTESFMQDNFSASFTAIPQLEELFPDQNATLPRSTKQNNGMENFTLKKESSELYSMALFGGIYKKFFNENFS
jgi:hypothetical protein